MEEKNKRVAMTDDKNYAPRKSAPRNETQNYPRPLPSPWSNSRQAYHNFRSAGTSSVNPAVPVFYSPWLGSQLLNRPTYNYGSVYPRRSFSNLYPMATAGVGQSSLLGSGNRTHRTYYTEKNKNVMGRGPQSRESRPSTPPFKKSLQPTSKVTQESTEDGKMPSIPKSNGEELKRSAASESKQTTVVGHDVKNAGGSTKIRIKLQDLPSIKLQRSSTKPENGDGAQNVTGNENCNAVHENGNIASDHSETNPTDPNQKLSIDPNASANNPRLEKKESDQTNEHGKRPAMKMTSRRTKRKIVKLQDIPPNEQEQSSKMAGNGGAAPNVTSNENCNAVHENINIASDNFETNATELNQKLSAEPKTAGDNPQLRKMETDEEKEQRRKLAKKISSKRSRMKIKIEREKLIDCLESLDAENEALKKELQDLTDECERMEEENNGLLKEVGEEYGEETVMNLMNAQSTESVAGSGGGQS